MSVNAATTSAGAPLSTGLARCPLGVSQSRISAWSNWNPPRRARAKNCVSVAPMMSSVLCVGLGGWDLRGAAESDLRTVLLEEVAIVRHPGVDLVQFNRASVSLVVEA